MFHGILIALRNRSTIITVCLTPSKLPDIPWSVKHLSVYLSSSLSVCLSICWSVSICLPACLPICVRLSVYVYLSACLCLSISLPICPSVSVCLSIWPFTATSPLPAPLVGQQHKSKTQKSWGKFGQWRHSESPAGDRKRWTVTLRETLAELSGRGLKDNINMSQRLRSYSTLRKTTPTTTALLHQLNSTDHQSYHEARDRCPEDTSKVKPQLTTLTKSMTIHVHLMQQRPGLRLTLIRTCPFCWSAKGCGKT